MRNFTHSSPNATLPTQARNLRIQIDERQKTNLAEPLAPQKYYPELPTGSTAGRVTSSAGPAVVSLAASLACALDSPEASRPPMTDLTPSARFEKLLHFRTIQRRGVQSPFQNFSKREMFPSLILRVEKLNFTLETLQPTLCKKGRSLERWFRRKDGSQKERICCSSQDYKLFFWNRFS